MILIQGEVIEYIKKFLKPGQAVTDFVNNAVVYFCTDHTTTVTSNVAEERGGKVTRDA